MPEYDVKDKAARLMAWCNPQILLGDAVAEAENVIEAAYRAALEAAAKAAESSEATKGNGVGRLQRKIAKAIRALAAEGEK